MTADQVSEARQALRDYARQGYEIELSEVPGWAGKVPPHAKVTVVRGEAGGLAFVAAQAALTVAEELRAESREPSSPGFDYHALLEERSCRDAQAAAADRIEAAVAKALQP